MGSRSSSRNSTDQRTSNTSSNLNLQDTAGVTVGEAGGSVSITSTDAGAVRGIVDTAMASNDLARDLTSGALHANISALDDAYEVVNDTTRLAFDAVDSSNERAFSYFGSINSEALDFVRETSGNLYDKALAQVGGTVEALNAISVEQNKSTDQRVAEVSQNAIKYIAVVVGVVAFAALIYSFRKG